MSQLNLATDFTVTIYSDVSAWKTETSQTLRDNTAVWREVEKTRRPYRQSYKVSLKEKRLHSTLSTMTFNNSSG